MDRDHPTIDELEVFLGDPSRFARSRIATLIRHLLAACVTCRKSLGSAWPEARLRRLLTLAGTEARHGEAEPFSRSHDYSRAFAAAAGAVTRFFAQEGPLGEPAETLAAELLRLPDAEQLRRARYDSRFALPDVMRDLIERSHAMRYDDPRRMLHLADLARQTAGLCTAESAGNEARLADLRTRGWMQYGNALRVCGQLHEADDALSTAQRFRAAGTRDPLLSARLLEHLASLRTSQGFFRKAIEAADGAAQVYRDLDERHSLASTMVQKAIACLYAAETEAAVRILNRAIPLIDSQESPQLLLAACHNLMRAYIDLDRPEQALSLYYEARDLYRELDFASTIRLRAAWQEGQLLRDLGHLNAAETELLEARKGFLDRGIAYEVAMVSLDLASVYVRAGKVEELRRTVAEAVPIFRTLRVGREVIAALLQLQQAGGQEKKALELIHLLNTRLAPLSQRDPGGS